MLLKLSQVSERLNCSLSNVYALVDSGKLAAISTGAAGKGYRVPEEELQRFIEEGKKGRRPHYPAKCDPRPRIFTKLDGRRLRAAWQQQGVGVD